MKKLLFLALITLFSCRNNETDGKFRVYTFKVKYFDDKIDTIIYKHNILGPKFFTLHCGDLQDCKYKHVVVSYVKKFEILKIDTLK